MNVTFFTTANDIPPHYNTSAFLFIIPIIIIGYFINKRKNNIDFVFILLCSCVGWVFIGGILKFFDDNSFISNWINSAVAICTVGTVILAYFAYKYAIDTFIKQQQAKLLWDKKYNLLKDLINKNANFIFTTDMIIKKTNSVVDEITNSSINPHTDDLSLLIESCDTQLSSIVNTIYDIKEHLFEQTISFPELNMLGMSLSDIKQISSINLNNSNAIKKYAEMISQCLTIIRKIKIVIYQDDDVLLNDLVVKYKSLIKSPFDMTEINASYNEMITISRSILGIDLDKHTPDH